ncbi:hypothetical protein [Nitrospirillum bahiense]|uniref:hypothetical protein n=1 Tax=Nitrospirillum amazonense TaxID=28077 RepID=UPI0011A3FBD1|nr:hypothetical protein [Nitrospirillum amazonense]
MAPDVELAGVAGFSVVLDQTLCHGFKAGNDLLPKCLLIGEPITRWRTKDVGPNGFWLDRVPFQATKDKVTLDQSDGGIVHRADLDTVTESTSDVHCTLGQADDGMETRSRAGCNAGSPPQAMIATSHPDLSASTSPSSTPTMLRASQVPLIPPS